MIHPPPPPAILYSLVALICIGSFNLLHQYPNATLCYLNYVTICSSRPTIAPPPHTCNSVFEEVITQTVLLSIYRINSNQKSKSRLLIPLFWLQLNGVTNEYLKTMDSKAALVMWAGVVDGCRPIRQQQAVKSLIGACTNHKIIIIIIIIII